MELGNAEQQKALTAEKQISIVRSIVIVFGTLTFFITKNPFVKENLAYCLMAVIWTYGAYILFFKPYERYPIFLASWFTSVSDAVLTTLWVYATGGFFSPFHVIYYTSIVAVSFRFELKTVMFTSFLYSVCYYGLLYFMDQLDGNEGWVIVRTGFIFIIGFLTHLISRETLYQTQQKLLMQDLAREVQENHKRLLLSQENLKLTNSELSIRNDIFKHAEENAHIGSYALDIESNQMEYSDNLYRLLGYEPEEFEPTYAKYLEVIHPDDREEVLKFAAEALEKKQVDKAVIRVITKDKRIKHLRISGKFITEGKKEIIIGTLQDVTNDILLNETLKVQNLELERTNNELSSFNYVASHDLQEPVRKIHTFSNLILQRENGSLTENTRDYLKRISNSASRMQKLIEAFLNYSRISNSELKYEETDLNVLLEEVKNTMSELIQEKNATLEISKMPVINCIPVQMQQLFVNLIGNAIKYSKQDEPPHVKIKAEHIRGAEIVHLGADSKTDYWKIAVTDNGIGFEQQYAERIFEVFQRLHSKEQYAGTGIGLAICKKIAEFHKGFIKAKGEPGVGSVFTVYIPGSLGIK